MSLGLLIVAVVIACPPVDEIPERLALPAAAAVAGPQKLSGAWTRDTEMTRMTFVFGESKLTISLTFAPPEGVPVPGFTATLDADYTVSPDGVVYGVFTGGDAEPACIGAAVQLVDGHPFAFRAKTEGNITTIRDVKFFGASVPSHLPTKKEPKGIEEMTMAEAVTTVVQMTAGRYTKDDGKKPMKKAAAMPTTTTMSGMTLPSAPRGTGTIENVYSSTPLTAVPAQATGISGMTYPPARYLNSPGSPYSQDPQFPIPSPPGPQNVPPAFPVPPPSAPSPVPPGPPTAPAEYVPVTPNISPTPTQPTKPALLGAATAPKFPTYATTPPPVKTLTPPTAIDKAIEAAMAKLGTDPGIPEYYEMAVKEVDGVSVTMTWTANTFVNRIYFDIQTAMGEGDKVNRERFRISANFACGKDNVFYGIITDVDLEQGGAEFSSGTSITKALTGALFKFTQREVDGKMATRDVVVLSATAEKGDLNGIAEALAGKYTWSPGKPAGPPKPVPGRHLPGKAMKE